MILKYLYNTSSSYQMITWLEEPGGTPHVLGSTLRRSEFQARVKKILSPVPCQNTGLRPGSGRGHSHMNYGAAVYGWDRGSDFSQPA